MDASKLRQDGTQANYPYIKEPGKDIELVEAIQGANPSARMDASQADTRAAAAEDVLRVSVEGKIGEAVV